LGASVAVASFAASTFGLSLLVLSTFSSPAFSQQSQPGNATAGAQVIKVLGKIKTVQADSLTVTPTTGNEALATLSAATKILQVEPGAKDLKSAIPLQAKDLQTGDSVRVRGYANADGKSINALEVIVFKQADVAAKQQQQREDWQKRGVDGTVSSIDATAGTITITRGAFAAKQTLVLHVSKSTVLRRYAPGSVNFDDAKPAPIDQIKVGDQLNALGSRTGNEISAEEIVSGTFDYIEGTVKSVDAAANTMTVEDPVRKAVVLKVSSDSVMKKLSPEAAQRIAARLKGGSGESGDRGGAGQSPNAPAQQAANQQPSNSQAAASSDQEHGQGQHAGAGASGNGTGGNGAPDMQRILNRLPNATLADFQKDDAVMVVATGDAGNLTAIKVLAGVDAILRAAPNRGASALLSSWSLSSGGEGEGAQ
jgi:hypothetical protein